MFPHSLEDSMISASHGVDLIRDRSLRSSTYHGIDTEIIAASVRNPIHVTDCALAGADIATVPYYCNRADDKTSIDRPGYCKIPG